jgi:hypothetical protein
MGTFKAAVYDIVFKSTLPDSSYNAMTCKHFLILAVSHVTDMTNINGIVIYSVCPNTMEASMKCIINSNSNN